ncbi:MAG: hypothetical protein OJF50_004658 [Nitrospira sp.]|nr:hypothetical protein [Nitrospira sp.]
MRQRIIVEDASHKCIEPNCLGFDNFRTTLQAQRDAARVGPLGEGGRDP